MPLEVTDLKSSYGSIVVIKTVSFSVDDGSIVCFFGPNGHGKSTLLKTISGTRHPSSGSIKYNGRETSKLPSHEIVGMGVVYVPEEGHLFIDMSVLDNLSLGAYHRNAHAKKQKNLDFVLQLFPILKERLKQRCSTLSGGERRMVAIGRGLMASPTLLMLDEPSFGLAPIMVKATFEASQIIAKSAGISIVIVEQEIREALRIANYAFVLKKGQIVLQGDPALLSFENIQRVYF